MANSGRRIHLATGNAHKVQEFQRLAETAAIDIQFVRPAAMPVVIEDTGTFVGNARKKAAALKAILPPDAWVLADDSGLCVDALGGAPGVESAYFAGPKGDSATNLAKLVSVMRDVPDGKRMAHFVCVLILISGADGVERVFKADCHGALGCEPTGPFVFGYDPLFIPEGYSKTYAELGEEVKNVMSHRARAFNGLVRWLDDGRTHQGKAG